MIYWVTEWGPPHVEINKAYLCMQWHTSFSRKASPVNKMYFIPRTKQYGAVTWLWKGLLLKQRIKLICWGCPFCYSMLLPSLLSLRIVTSFEAKINSRSLEHPSASSFNTRTPSKVPNVWGMAHGKSVVKWLCSIKTDKMCPFHFCCKNLFFYSM